MGGGKIEIKKIEKQANRQVTYSKRRNGLFKKAHELSVLCDAKVSIIMISSSHKLHQYITPTTSTKQLLDQYQNAIGVDLWSSHYEKMQEHLNNLNEVNRNLRREIRQRMGESLNDLNYNQLVSLIEDVDNSLQTIRGRKFKAIGNQIETGRKKLRNVEQVHRKLLFEFQDPGQEYPPHALIDSEMGYNCVIPFGQ
ncbi:Floral homeotic protein APETALA 3 [Forsythia ovata]|uniref:Floral homeotic protein APETALA 3 n=1 Tax=Forsythia ovata TaxID=205694 RepID=A0ABD1UBF3_9LAMI